MVKVEGKVHPRTGHECPGGGLEVYLYSFFNLSTRWRWVVNATPWPLYPWERDPVPIGHEAGWPLGLVWTVLENLAPTGIRFLDRPSCSESLY